jgi:hypothetical protein
MRLALQHKIEEARGLGDIGDEIGDMLAHGLGRDVHISLRDRVHHIGVQLVVDGEENPVGRLNRVILGHISLITLGV